MSIVRTREIRYIVAILCVIIVRDFPRSVNVIDGLERIDRLAERTLIANSYGEQFHGMIQHVSSMAMNIVFPMVHTESIGEHQENVAFEEKDIVVVVTVVHPLAYLGYVQGLFDSCVVLLVQFE